MGFVALVTEEKSNAESLIQNPGERVRGIDGDRGKERVDLVGVKLQGLRPSFGGEVCKFAEANLFGFKGGQKKVVPAGVLRLNEVGEQDREAIEPFLWRKAAFIGGLRLTDPVLNALQNSGNPDLYKLVEVAGRDGEKLYALEQGIGGILRFLQDALIEMKPRLVTGEEEGINRMVLGRRSERWGCDGLLCRTTAWCGGFFG